MTAKFRAATRMRCHACGVERPAGEPPFRCPRAGAEDDLDHLLRRELSLPALRAQFSRVEGDRSVPADEATLRTAVGFEGELAAEQNPFVRWRRLLHVYQAYRAGGAVEGAFGALVRRLDEAVAAVEQRQHGFRETPLAREAALSEALGVGAVWVKDESGNVAGSHKARHMMGIALALETLGVPAERPLAVASCGNAALGAAVVARAAGRPLTVYVPVHADEAVIERLTAAEATIERCPREAGLSGDPCYLAFRAALAGGALPMSVQGSDNGLAVEGALPLGYELCSALATAGESVDAVMLQVGGGALASAVIAAYRDARALGVLDALPRFFAVQTHGARPLARAYEGIARAAARLLSLPDGPAESDAERAERAERLAADDDQTRAARSRALSEAARTRSRYMWPWEHEPQSIASGILDDETYDWHAICAGLLASGGWVVTASEADLARANTLGREAGYPVCHTGSSGLAGAMQLARDGALDASARVAVIFSGNHREADGA